MYQYFIISFTKGLQFMLIDWIKGYILNKFNAFFGMISKKFINIEEKEISKSSDFS